MIMKMNDFAAARKTNPIKPRQTRSEALAGRTYSTAVIAPDVNNSNWGIFDGTAFTGVFDGNDHKITGLTIDDGGAGNWYLGLLGCINGGEVRNLALEGGSGSGYRFVGALVGANWGSVSNCYSTGDVNGGQYVGGLVGYGGMIWNCYSTGNVNGIAWVGGLVGKNAGGIISNCYSTGSVSGTGSYVGGLLGETFLGIVSNCYSIGDVSGTTDSIGGLVGYNNDASVSDSFWDTDTQTHGITASIGHNEGTATNVASLPTTLMQTKSTFTSAGWDFVEIWLINEGATYPVLRQEIRSDLNGDGGVDLLDFAIFADHWLEGRGN